jgi:predicted RNase H-like HicB family nuclease
MNLRIKSVCAQGEDYNEVIQSLTEAVNKTCEEISNDPNIAIKDIRYEQSIKTYYMRTQKFYVTAFIHYAV